MSLFRRSVLLLAVGTVLSAAPAWAHVSVKAVNARQGAAATLTFRVPTERSVATTAFRVVLPAESRVTTAGPRPMRGWSVTVARESGRVTALTWTATGGGVPPEQTARFAVTLGPLPYTPRLVLPTLQTYADGEVVRWTQTSDGAEHPAPVLSLAAPLKPSPAVAAPTVTPSPSASIAGFPAADDDEGIDRGALTGIGFAILAALLGAFALLRRRQA